MGLWESPIWLAAHLLCRRGHVAMSHDGWLECLLCAVYLISWVSCETWWGQVPSHLMTCYPWCRDLARKAASLVVPPLCTLLQKTSRLEHSVSWKTLEGSSRCLLFHVLVLAQAWFIALLVLGSCRSICWASNLLWISKILSIILAMSSVSGLDTCTFSESLGGPNRTGEPTGGDYVLLSYFSVLFLGVTGVATPFVLFPLPVMVEVELKTEKKSRTLGENAMKPSGEFKAAYRLSSVEP